MSGVYAILNTETGEMYIGSSKDLFYRFNDHIRSLRRGNPGNRKLRVAVEEYGHEAFTVVVLEKCEVEFLFQRETHWISELNPEYNILTVV